MQLDSFEVIGGQPLKGELQPQGAKNEALQIISAVLLTDDPQRNLEVLDACVILPEALKPVLGRINCWVADEAASPALMQRRLQALLDGHLDT